MIDEAPPLVFIGGGVRNYGAKLVRKELGKEVIENVINKFKQANVFNPYRMGTQNRNYK